MKKKLGNKQNEIRDNGETRVTLETATTSLPAEQVNNGHKIEVHLPTIPSENYVIVVKSCCHHHWRLVSLTKLHRVGNWVGDSAPLPFCMKPCALLTKFLKYMCNMKYPLHTTICCVAHS